ncbi:hypothetical protein GOP47_0023384 [Adiantum capillus-veneris]|uniref:Uncharacterized protein n=1 Tax=Adiantum capillus-veneris TaxID=13818 RepID=A0A9D4Z4E9_ADICA|nr:hypothetical protein GOP47_0023384 [Adiantum capillus-veneris]
MGSNSQVMLEIFGSSSICEGHDEDIDMEDPGNALQDDMELHGMPSANPTSSNVETNAPDTSKKKKVRKFRDEWLHKFNFLKRLVIEDKEFMKCIWCEKYKQKGPWGKERAAKQFR